MPKHQTLLVINEDYLPALMKLIGTAKKSIDILAYSFAIGSANGKLATGSAPYRIAEKLVALRKKNKKLRIRLYIEAFRETSSRNMVTVNYLKKAGVQIRLGATHAKGFLIDGKYLLFGSTNLTHQSIVKNNETNLAIQDSEVIEQFERYFSHCWKGGGHGGIHLDLPMYADGDFKDALISLIDSAKKKLDFSIYFFSHREIEEAFVRAYKRNVKIRGFLHQHRSFALWYVQRTKAMAERLRKAGIKNLSYGPSHLFTHSKYIVVDGEHILLGTGNWLPEDVNIHPQLYLQLRDKKLASEISKTLTAQIRKSK